jgi:hypothetical protein
VEDLWTGALHVAVRWRQDPQPDTLAPAEVEVLRRHLVELMREVQRLQEADEPPE